MDNLAARRERFQQDHLPTRLGGLAANLARVSSFSNLARGPRPSGRGPLAKLKGLSN